MSSAANGMVRIALRPSVDDEGDGMADSAKRNGARDGTGKRATERAQDGLEARDYQTNPNEAKLWLGGRVGGKRGAAYETNRL